jgi:hypothetical protein
MRRILGIGMWALAAMAQVPQATPGSGLLEGTVTDADSHEPVRKAQVSLSGGPVQLLAVVTDASGRFAFQKLPPGTYALSAWRQGYNPPYTLMGGQANPVISLAEGEQRKGVEIALTRGGTLAGRVTNEEGAGVRGCQVSAARPGSDTGSVQRGMQQGMQQALSNDKGEYRIADLPRGRYVVYVHCHVLLPAAHPLMPRGDPGIPHETYLPKFYGGGVDPSTATKLMVATGATVEGIDFQVSRGAALAVRGSVTGSDPEAVADGVSLMLAPNNGTPHQFLVWHGYANQIDRKFVIQPVIPGSYMLYAFSRHGARVFAGERAVAVGKTPLEPVEISLAAGIDLKGSVQMDGDSPRQQGVGFGQVILNSVAHPLMASQPMGNLAPDGTFTVSNVLPGRWRLNLNGAGYVKSVSLAGQPVSPFGFDIAAGSSGPLTIVMGSSLASVTVHIAGDRPEGQISALLFPADAERMGTGLERIGSATSGDSIQLANIQPGRYRVLATDIQNPWPLVEMPDVLRALEGHTAMVEVTESGPTSTTVEIIPREELMRVVDGQQ